MMASQCHEGPRFLPSAIFSMWFPSLWSSDGCWSSSHQVHIVSGKGKSLRAKCTYQLVGSHPRASTYVSLARFSSVVIWQGRLEHENIESGLLMPQTKVEFQGFPGGAVVESLPANVGDAGSGPGLGGSRVPRSDWAREPQLLGLRVWSLCSAAGEAAVVRGPHTAMERGPRLPQLGKALAQKRRPNIAINQSINQ